MKVEINKVGKIDSVTVDINGLTVIAGPNNTGKSTISKALFASYFSLENYRNNIIKDRRHSISSLINNFIFSIDRDDYTEFQNPNMIVKKIMNQLEQYYEGIEGWTSDVIVGLIKNEVEKLNVDVSDDDFDQLYRRLNMRLKLSDEAILSRLTTRNFNNEFSGQIKNLKYADSETKVILTIDKKQTTFKWVDRAGNVHNPQNLSKKIIYIGDPNVVEHELRSLSRRRRDVLLHDSRLYRLYNKSTDDDSVSNEIIADDKIQQIYHEFSKISDLHVVQTKDSFFGGNTYADSKGLEYDWKNLSEGLKTFEVLQTLIRNGSLVEGGTLILDEPEIHLHPEWQVSLAKIIVLIQKQFQMHILLTTHSPYFLRAIEVFSKQYKVNNQNKYYLSSLNKDGDGVVSDVSNEINKVYAELTRPFMKLQMMDYELEES